MSRTQGAANGGWPVQRPAAGEPDPRSGGHPAQRAPQAPQQAPQAPHPQQYAHPGQPAGYPPQAPNYGEPQTQPPPYAPQQGYHYPQQSQAPQYAPPQAPVPNRQALSSLDSARNAQPTHDLEGFPRTQPPQYPQPPRQGQPQAPQRARVADQDPIRAAGGYRQMPPQAAPQYAPRAPQAPQSHDPSFGAGYDQWGAPQQDPYGQDLGGYLPVETPFPANSNHPAAHDPLQSDWTMTSAGYGDPVHEQTHRGGQLGYDQAHGGALEQTYNQDEAGTYEVEEPRRRSWTMRIAGAVVVAIGLGYGLAQAYKAVLGAPPDGGAPPVIASDATPAKEKPLDPGGKQFAHTDSKVLGRLGESGSASTEQNSGGLSETDTNSNGSRKVTTLVVGRDGSIEPPSGLGEQAPAQPEPSVSVPGLTVVDAFGSAAQHPPQHPAAQAEPESAPEPPRAHVNVKSTRVIPASTASIPDEQPAAPVAPTAPKRQKVATAAPAADEGASASASGANGYVVVLASVPASGNSRLDALKKFADMQQQYGSVLANKTPDVRETTLPGKGAYHRLLVGPPGSRAQASATCTQLKASGYKDCWVTAY